ncbi:hypothetical protein CSIM01_06926 [Colletotrichum simmondsii]|uniref:Uncharacterized protein n=1 Tax=Colletotrichum simmondsii TaxID=703756 RepID=A0A135SXU0_9PEZI|nr:hypothetical protein CSIM01_06926 [Colletotrichum simmondsii]
MSGQTIEVVKPKSQQDSHQHESTCPNLDDVVKALQNRPPLPDVSSQGISTQPFYLHESHPHQADISLPPATMSVNTQPQQHTDFSVSSAGGPKIDREPVVASEPATVPRLEPAVDDGPILSQGNPISAEQPSLTSADSKSESQPSAAPRVHAPFWKVWWQEILCIMISYASLLAIVVVLASHDNHTLPKWRFKITLNTFLAFFATLAKGAFMLPVSTALSQLKFTWFMKTRPLHDFQVFEQASRSWWGSMKLLFWVRLKHTVTIGAILTIISILSSPVTQLAISYPLRNTTAIGEEAKIVTINEINLLWRNLAKMASTASLKATISDTGNFEVPAPPLKALCSTGHCDFDPYQSLGVCVDIANITSKLRIEPINNLTLESFGEDEWRLAPGRKTWSVSLSGNYSVLHQNPLFVKGGLLMGDDTFGFWNNASLLNTKIASFFFIYTTPLPPNRTQDDSNDSYDDLQLAKLVRDFEYEASEVMFHICVQKFKTRVRMGAEETYIIDTFSQTNDTSGGFVLGPICRPRRDGTRGCQPSRDPGNLTAHIEPPKFGTRKFSASYRAMWNMGVGVFPLNILYADRNIFNSTRRAACFKNIFLDIATSISSALRTAHHQEKSTGVVVIDGTPLNEVSYVHISWGWISFLAVEILAATLFLVMVIIAQSASSRKREPEDAYIPVDIKDLSLATLVVLSNDCREALSDGLQLAGDLQEASKKLQVTLRGNELVIAADLGVQSSHPGKQNPQEAHTEEHGLLKNRSFGRILTSIRAWRGEYEVSEKDGKKEGASVS